MKAVIGYFLDSAAYPDALGQDAAAVGTVVTGFRGLVGILETQLGLISPAGSEIRRIAEWEQRIRQYEEEQRLLGGESAPFSKSFDVDPWNTAKELLIRRDELILAGWNPSIHHGGGRLIETLGMLELQPGEITPGFPDRVRVVISRLRTPAQLELTEVTIVDEETLWEPWFNELIQTLRKQGVRVEVCPPCPDESLSETSHAESDLTLLQRIRRGELPPSEASGDGSLTFVQAATERDAADAMVSWLEACGADGTVVIHQQPSILLYDMLHDRGLPATGVDKPSPWRSVLQVLPLTIETY